MPFASGPVIPAVCASLVASSCRLAPGHVGALKEPVSVPCGNVRLNVPITPAAVTCVIVMLPAAACESVRPPVTVSG